MPALIAASAIRTCLGDGERTFAALVRGESGVAPLRHLDATSLNVSSAYQIHDGDDEALFRPNRWLTACVREALDRARLATARRRVIAIVGTGLRELRAVERAAMESLSIPTERLHFDAAIREACPQVRRVITLSNACSAGGHALALAQDLIELGEADVAIAAATDGLTASMVAMIGRFSNLPTERVRPFDVDRTGALLGEGATALIVVPDGAVDQPCARLLSTGLSCDAVHETVPNRVGILRAIENAFASAGRTPADVDLVVAHGTGTALNDPLEASLLQHEFATRSMPPLVTGIKGALGHTSGAAALMGVDVAMRCFQQGVVPPVIGLRRPILEASGVRLVIGSSVITPVRLAQINAFGFGGVNAVTLVEAA